MAANPFAKQDPALEVVLLPSAAVTTAGTVNGTAYTGIAAYRQANFLLDVTAAATDSADTLDVYIDTSLDNGVTWINVIHFTQVLGNGGAKQFWAVLDPSGAPPATVTAVASDAAAGVVRPSVFGDSVRVRHISVDGSTGGNMSFTFAVKALFKK